MYVRTADDYCCALCRRGGDYRGHGQVRLNGAGRYRRHASQCEQAAAQAIGYRLYHRESHRISWNPINYKILCFGHQKRIWGTKNRHWRPLPKTLHKHNVLGRFFEPRRQKKQFWSGKVRFGREFVVFSVLERSVWSWEAQKPQYSYRNIEVSSPGRPATPQNP